MEVFEVEEVLISFVEEVLDVFEGFFTSVFFKFLNNLSFGGFVMIETEFVLKDPFKFGLSFSEEVVGTSHEFLFKSRDLGLPGVEFSRVTLDLDLESTKFFSDVLKGNSKLFISLKDLLTFKSNIILFKTSNVTSKSFKVSLNSKSIFGHLDQLSLDISHGDLQFFLVFLPGLDHFFKRKLNLSFFSISNFSLFLGVSLKDESFSDGFFDIFVLEVDQFDFVVHSDLLLLREDESSEEVKSPVEVVVEHVEGLRAGGLGDVSLEGVGLSTSGLDLLLDDVRGRAFSIVFVLIDRVGETVGFVFLDLFSGRD